MGGDGSVSWTMTEMESVQYTVTPPALIAVPLGTGNDLARAMGCGGNASSVRKVVAILKVSCDESSSRVRRNNIALPRARGGHTCSIPGNHGGSRSMASEPEAGSGIFPRIYFLQLLQHGVRCTSDCQV